MVKNINSILFQDISQLIETARNIAAHHANATLVRLYWHMGIRINQDILKNEHAEYGNQIIKTLAQRLTVLYGRGFDSRALFRMTRFARQFPEKQIVETLSPLLSWSHFREL